MGGLGQSGQCRGEPGTEWPSSGEREAGTEWLSSVERETRTEWPVQRGAWTEWPVEREVWDGMAELLGEGGLDGVASREGGLDRVTGL